MPQCLLQVGVKGSEYGVGTVKGQQGLFSAACEVVDSDTGMGGVVPLGVSHLLLLCERDDLIGKCFME